MKHILAFLLHHANRYTKLQGFYVIKDHLLKKYGVHLAYDIQHIPGKKCWSCGGTGEHARYSNTYPYKPYDYDACWHCVCGWYQLPKWICLDRIKFSTYIFHRPLKREERVRNPFTEEQMGWKVSDTIIKGYIEHTSSWFGVWALLILFRLYNREAYCKELPVVLDKVKYNLRWKWRRFKRIFTWSGFVLHKPQPFINHWFDAAGNGHETDLPF
jgi:hypothetical protein